MMKQKIPLYLAPMAGITDKVFRGICFARGCDTATTEMISAQGYLTAPRELNVYRFLLDTAPGEGPLLAQIFGKEPEYLAEAARRLTDTGKFTGIDINMGCPAQKVTSGGAGSALMRDLPLAGRIIQAVVCATLLPVSVKMRLGWDEHTVNAGELAHIAQECGASCVTVHGRTREQQYAGNADWEAIARVRQRVSIRVIANGDVRDGGSARAILEKTGCDGIAVGRGALGNPWIFGEIKAALADEPWEPPSYAEVMRTALSQARDMAAWKGEKSAILEMRKHFSWYISGHRGAARLRTRINTAATLSEVEELLNTLTE